MIACSACYELIYLANEMQSNWEEIINILDKGKRNGIGELEAEIVRLQNVFDETIKREKCTCGEIEENEIPF